MTRLGCSSSSLFTIGYELELVRVLAGQKTCSSSVVDVRVWVSPDRVGAVAGIGESVVVEGEVQRATPGEAENAFGAAVEDDSIDRVVGADSDVRRGGIGGDESSSCHTGTSNDPSVNLSLTACVCVGECSTSTDMFSCVVGLRCMVCLCWCVGGVSTVWWFDDGVASSQVRMTR